MTDSLFQVPPQYETFLQELKERIRSAQVQVLRRRDQPEHKSGTNQIRGEAHEYLQQSLQCERVFAQGLPNPRGVPRTSLQRLRRTSSGRPPVASDQGQDILVLQLEAGLVAYGFYILIPKRESRLDQLGQTGPA